MTQTAEAFLDRWHAMIAKRDVSALPEMIAADATFRSPFFFAPQQGRDYMVNILTAVVQVLEDFTYHRELIQGSTLALEFSARVGELSVKGIDLIELDADGRIAELEVFIRPMNGLQAVGQEMMKRLAGAD